MRAIHVPLAAAASLCEQIRQEGYGRDPLGARLDCWGCLQAGAGLAFVSPTRASRCERVVERYKRMIAEGKIGWV